MSQNPVLNTIYNVIYPQPEPNRTRDRPLRVLALGFSRSGTESLARALSQLGYNTVYHGFNVVTSAPDCAFWARLALARQKQQKRQQGSSASPSSSITTEAYFSAANFDRALGHCGAITDAPGCFFATELVHAYPDAQVVLNRRRDVDAWCRSIETNFVPIVQSWRKWARSWWDVRAFWGRRCHELITAPCYGIDGYRAFSVEAGRRRYEEHYGRLEELLQREGRAYLNWNVEEGWSPLCEFLGKEVPEGEFPRGNDSEAFKATRAKMMRETNRKIPRRMMMAAGIVIAGIAIMIKLL
ncbi:MAG: hypothetical protein M1821_003056 [Bathelium mastoideum]|nr:MAG: hypothetical protein M1821_003056 [Bathelium mastoideum]